MNWQHSIDAARLLAGSSPSAQGRPRQMMLRRALSTAYYAMFHALCESNADVLVGVAPSGADAQLWVDTFRALQHNAAKNRLAQYVNIGQDPTLTFFARTFSEMQEQRIIADYEPSVMFTRSEVIRLINRVESEIHAFRSLPARTRRGLAIYLLVRRAR